MRKISVACKILAVLGSTVERIGLEVHPVTYIENIPQPFLDDLVNNQVVPFVGAGLSFNAIPPLPSFEGIAIELGKQIPGYNLRKCIEPANQYWIDPIDVMAAYQQAFGRTQLIETLATRLNPPVAEPGGPINAFAQLPFPIVATSNFDCLLENAYHRIGIPVAPQVSETQIAVNIAPQGVRLFKFHGDFNHPEEIAVTEKDYDDYVSRYPLKATYLSYLLAAYTPFFIGYSLSDHDLRTVLRLVGQQIGLFQRLGYSIQVNATPDAILRLRRRNVYTINYVGNEYTYPAVLTGVFTELLAYWTGEMIRDWIATDPEVAAALTNGAARNNLCFIAIVPERLAAYKNSIYPIIREHGSVPVALSDIATKIDSVAKIFALAERSARIVTDSSFTYANYLQHRYPKTKLFIAEPPTGNGGVKPQALGSELAAVGKALRKWLK